MFIVLVDQDEVWMLKKKRSECWSRKKNQKCSKSHTKSVYPFCKLYFCKTLWIMLLKSRLFFHQILIMLFKTHIFFGLITGMLFISTCKSCSFHSDWGLNVFLCVCFYLYTMNILKAPSILLNNARKELLGVWNFECQGHLKFKIKLMMGAIFFFKLAS